MTATTTQTVPVLEIIPETPDTHTFRLGATFAYKPGQSIALTIPGDPKKRYYSLSSSPTEKGYIAITIKAADQQRALYGSLFSLKKGSSVEVSGPYGSMTLPDLLDGPFYFLAAGSGVTPFRSMVKFILDTRPATPMWLIHSVKTPDDLIFKDELLAWTKKNPSFHFVPTFTRWNDTDYTGDTGRIGEKLLRKHDPAMHGTFCLCGPKEFVKDMEHVLTQLQVGPDRIRREQWST